MPENTKLVHCYNRGCGKQFDIANNDKGNRILDISITPVQPDFQETIILILYLYIQMNAAITRAHPFSTMLTRAGHAAKRKLSISLNF